MLGFALAAAMFRVVALAATRNRHRSDLGFLFWTDFRLRPLRRKSRLFPPAIRWPGDRPFAAIIDLARWYATLKLLVALFRFLIV